MFAPKQPPATPSDVTYYTGRPDAEVEFVGRVREVSRPAKGEGAEGIFTIPHAPWDGNIYPAISPCSCGYFSPTYTLNTCAYIGCVGNDWN